MVDNLFCYLDLLFKTLSLKSVTFNSSEKDFSGMHLLIQFTLVSKLAGDIFPFELLLLSISFMYLKTMSVETNSNFKLKEFLNLSLIILILGWLLNYINNFKGHYPICIFLLAGFRIATSLKKRLWYRCFPVNFAKFLRTPLFNNTSGGCFWLLWCVNSPIVKPFLFRKQ